MPGTNRPKSLAQIDPRYPDFTTDNLDIPGSNQTAKDDKDKLVDEENYKFNKKGTSKKNKNLENLPDPDTKRNK